jgi:hypothetical protein
MLPPQGPQFLPGTGTVQVFMTVGGEWGPIYVGSSTGARTWLTERVSIHPRLLVRDCDTGKVETAEEYLHLT